jgi:hypothetical protein
MRAQIGGISMRRYSIILLSALLLSTPYARKDDSPFEPFVRILRSVVRHLIPTPTGDSLTVPKP